MQEKGVLKSAPFLCLTVLLCAFLLLLLFNVAQILSEASFFH